MNRDTLIDLCCVTNDFDIYLKYLDMVKNVPLTYDYRNRQDTTASKKTWCKPKSKVRRSVSFSI